MADLEGNLEADRFHTDTPVAASTFHVKGAESYDYGMKHRLGRIFSPESGRTVMLAFDHGYFQGPTSGLERLDLNIAPLARHADALMATRGALRTSIPPSPGTPLVVRASGGPSILKDLSDERIAMDMSDAVRIDASAVAVQVFVGGPGETQSVYNMTRLVDAGINAGVPVLGVTAVGRELTRDARYLRLATRIIAELGAQMVKTYYCDEDFETVTSSCPVPVIMAGGKKLPVDEALDMAYKAIDQGAAGVDMGRNIFQRGNPDAMIRTVRAVVHEGLAPADGVEMYRDLSGGLVD